MASWGQRRVCELADQLVEAGWWLLTATPLAVVLALVVTFSSQPVGTAAIAAQPAVVRDAPRIATVRQTVAAPHPPATQRFRPAKSPRARSTHVTSRSTAAVRSPAAATPPARVEHHSDGARSAGVHQQARARVAQRARRPARPAHVAVRVVPATAPKPEPAAAPEPVVPTPAAAEPVQLPDEDESEQEAIETTEPSPPAATEEDESPDRKAPERKQKRKEKRDEKDGGGSRDG